MNNANKHPEDELLAAYSAASLPLSQALCISIHLERCPDCGRKLQRLNRVGSELMQQLKPAPAADELKNRLLDRLDYDDLPWRRVSADIRSVELCRDSNGARVELLKIKPGGSAITHTHLGDEYTVILEGSFSDEAGLYGEGDFLLRGKHDKHTPVASLHRECLCLAVTEGPIQFTGFFSRLMNPFIRRSYA
jgi:putative transcriptional regulator